MYRLDDIERLIAPALEDMGYEVVRLQLQGQKRKVLQVMAERRDDAAMTVEDCADISRAVSAILDVEDPIDEAYTLEVSSPGIDRPLVRRKDFQRFAGLEARVEVDPAIDGRKRFRGRLAGIEGDTVRLDVEGTVQELPFGDIRRAKLILTDELLRAAARDQAED